MAESAKVLPCIAPQAFRAVRQFRRDIQSVGSDIEYNLTQIKSMNTFRTPSKKQPPASLGRPDPVIAQAKRDLDAGLVDTDMRATPGLDAQLRRKLVPGAGGKPQIAKI